MTTTTRDKIAAQDLILKAIAEVEKVCREKSQPAVAEAVEIERDRLAKKWGVS